jgi:hypothetical protein
VRKRSSSCLEFINQLWITLGSNSNRSQAKELERGERKNQITKIVINAKIRAICFLRFNFLKSLHPRWGVHKGRVSFNLFPISHGHKDRVSFLHHLRDTKSRKDLHTKNEVSCLALQSKRMVKGVRMKTWIKITRTHNSQMCKLLSLSKSNRSNTAQEWLWKLGDVALNV